MNQSTLESKLRMNFKFPFVIPAMAGAILSEARSGPVFAARKPQCISDARFMWVMGALVAGCLSSAGIAADFTTERWRVAEIPLTGSVSYVDSFQDVDVTATFTGPGGETLVRPAFWDGGNSWKIRFAPTVVG